MLLAIDVGNTHTVLGLFDGRGPRRALAGRHRRRGAPPTRWRWCSRGCSASTRCSSGADVSGIALCSTVPSVLHELREMCRRYYGDVPAVIVEPGVRTGVPVLMDNPKEVGTDRIVNALAAVHLYGGPCVVVDFGTATTFDACQRKRRVPRRRDRARHRDLGGRARRAGAQLRKVELVRPALGDRQEHGRGAAVRHPLRLRRPGRRAGRRGWSAELADDPDDEVATGGLAPLVVEECETIQHHEPDLTLIGLRLVYERNT